MNVVVNFTTDRAGAHIGGGGLRHDGFDVAAMAGEAIFAAVAEVPGVADAAAGGDNLHQRSGDPVEGNFSAQGIDFHVTVLHVGESDGTIQGFHAHVAARHVANLDGSGSAFQGYVAVKLLGA